MWEVVIVFLTEHTESNKSMNINTTILWVVLKQKSKSLASTLFGVVIADWIYDRVGRYHAFLLQFHDSSSELYNFVLRVLSHLSK